MKRILLALLLAGSLYGANDTAEQEGYLDSQMGITGNWNCARKKLQCNGVIITGSYYNELLGNPWGGRDQGFTNAGSLGINLELDFGKFSDAEGLHFFVSLVDRSGSSLSAKYIDNQFPVQQVYGNESYRLNELYFKQLFLDNRLTLKAGRLDGGNDFFQSPLYYNYVSNAFCGNPIAVFFNTPFTAYPNATWGGYIDCRPFKELFIRTAVYTGNAHALVNHYHGLNFTFKCPQGIMAITEWAYQPGNGNYRAGYYYVTKGETNPNNYGYYFLLDRSLNEHLSPFLTLLFAPKDKNLLPFFFTAGLVYKAFPGRPNDSASLGMAYGHYSPKNQNFETVLEANYWWEVTPSLAITPDVQYVINPQGFGTIPNAWVFGVQIALTL